MPDPASPLGVLLYALLAAALLAGLKWAYAKVKTIDMSKPLGMIAVVIIGTGTAVVIVGLIFWLYAHVRIA